MARRRSALALMLLSLCCGGEPAPQPPRVRVLLIGDSITAGRVSAPKGPAYAQLLSLELGPGFDVVNLACGSTSSLDWTRSRGWIRCGREVMLPNLYERRVRPALPADLVTVLLGTNDSQGIQEERRVPVDAYEAALRELASDLLADGAGRVMLLGPPSAVRKVPAMLLVVRYGEAQRRVCADLQGVVCGPDLRRVLGPGDFAEGNLHPNGEGHRKIADALERALRALYPGAGASSDAAAASRSPGRSHSARAPAASSSSRLP